MSTLSLQHPKPLASHLQVAFEVDGVRAVVHLVGAIDLVTEEHLRRALHRMVASSNDHEVLVDFQELTFISAAGIGIIADLAEVLSRHGRRLEVQNPSPFVVKILHLLDLAALLPGLSVQA